MKILTIICITFFLFHCNHIQNLDNSSKSILQNLALLFIRSNRATISGTATKGIIKNGLVTVNSLNKDGSCNMSTNLAFTQTDESGNYSLTYTKIGGSVCLVVQSDPSKETKMFDEKSNSILDIPLESNFKLTTILPESKISGTSRKNVLISPLSSFAAARFQNLVISTGGNADTKSLYKKASKEVVIRFGLNKGLSALSTKSIYSPKATTNTSISDNDFPELEDLDIEISNPKNSLAAKYISILAGFSQLANTYKKNSKVSHDDIQSVINAFSSDFEDGSFDGKKADGTDISIGSDLNKLTFSSTPLTSHLLPSITSYLKEGGKISIGNPSTTSITVDSTQVTKENQFVDNTPILSNIPVLTLTYSGNPYTYYKYLPVNNTPSVSGTITDCTITPSLPTGLNFSATTCAISGSTSAISASTAYSIVATNSIGEKVTSTIFLRVASISEFSFSSLINATHWLGIQAELLYQRSFGVSGSPTVDSASISGITGTDKWVGGVVATNGKIYTIPTDDTRVMIINPTTNTVDLTSITGITGTNKWSGGVLAPNGKIYAIPRDDSRVMIIDPTSNTVAFINVDATLGKWNSGVLAPNGKIYAIPRNDTRVMIIDPVTNSIDLTSITGVGTDTGKWYSGVLAPNGKIYTIPASDSRVMIIDPTTNTVDLTSITGVGVSGGSSKWTGGVIAPNGKIYGIPAAETRVLIIDPFTNTVDLTSITGLSSIISKWNGGALAPNGKIYAIPYDETSVLIIDPLTNTADTTSISGLSAGTNKWSGMVLGGNGKIYGICRDETSVLIVDPKSNGSFPTSFLLSGYLNKF